MGRNSKVAAPCARPFERARAAVFDLPRAAPPQAAPLRRRHRHDGLFGVHLAILEGMRQAVAGRIGRKTRAKAQTDWGQSARAFLLSLVPGPQHSRRQTPRPTERRRRRRRGGRPWWFGGVGGPKRLEAESKLREWGGYERRWKHCAKIEKRGPHRQPHTPPLRPRLTLMQPDVSEAGKKRGGRERVGRGGRQLLRARRAVEKSPPPPLTHTQPAPSTAAPLTHSI